MKYLYTSLMLATLLVFGSGIALTATGQEARESVAEWEKTMHPVFTATYAYSPEIVEGALMEKLQQDHIQAKQRKHTIACEGVVYPALSSSPLDLYFQTESKSRKSKNTTLNLFISKGRDNFIGKKYDEEVAKNALVFLDDFQEEVAYYALRQEINDKEKALEKVRKDYEDLLDDKQKLHKDLYDRQKDLSMADSDKEAKKARRKIERIDKKIRKTENSTRKTEREMEQQKGEIQALRSRLLRMREEQ